MIKEEKEIIRLQIGKEEAKLIVVDDIIVYRENLINPTKKGLKPINENWQNSGIQSQYLEIEGIFV